MGGTDVTEVTRRGLTKLDPARLSQKSKMKPVVLAREHGAVNENLRHSRKCHDPGDHDY
jgi:hypothetical protein